LVDHLDGDRFEDFVAGMLIGSALMVGLGPGDGSFDPPIPLTATLPPRECGR
jgi:hypothetical protein